MQNLSVTVIITILFIWPFFVNLYTLKYLTDIKRNEHCKEINSPYLVWFFDYYLFGLVVLILSLVFIVYIINHKKMKHLNFDLKLFQNVKDESCSIMYLIIVGISLFYVKLLYDIGQEETCKDIDHTMRRNLFYYNLAGIVYSGFILIKNLKN